MIIPFPIQKPPDKPTNIFRALCARIYVTEPKFTSYRRRGAIRGAINTRAAYVTCARGCWRLCWWSRVSGFALASYAGLGITPVRGTPFFSALMTGGSFYPPLNPSFLP